MPGGSPIEVGWLGTVLKPTLNIVFSILPFNCDPFLKLTLIYSCLKYTPTIYKDLRSILKIPIFSTLIIDN